ncbi:MAG: polyprenyl synthetase family protein [Pseudomonadota bacterium]|nr:polyprenyl synthetase family protein [Pseudomonadota bacterium]
MISLIGRQIAEAANLIERALASVLPNQDGAESRLFEAMRYGSLGGGKRLRPFLVLESAKLFGVNPDCALRVAVALEMIHCYSLIHDDLPAMDDGTLRRGKPTVHLQYDQATAVLAGDGLLTQAFEVLASPQTHEDPHIRCALVTALARAAGPRGMVAGQMLDMVAREQALDIGAITRLQRLKTGELMAFSCESGAILGRASPSWRQALLAYAHDLGLAFQMTDDLLDAEGREEDTGKNTGRDEQSGKATFVSILGIDRARAQTRMLADQACKHLDTFGDRAATLKSLARHVVERRA